MTSKDFSPHCCRGPPQQQRWAYVVRTLVELNGEMGKKTIKLLRKKFENNEKDDEIQGTDVDVRENYHDSIEQIQENHQSNEVIEEHEEEKGDKEEKKRKRVRKRKAASTQDAVDADTRGEEQTNKKGKSLSNTNEESR